jgi:hypothetical protein
MAFGSVTLVPGVNTERTPTLLRAGISQSSLIRFKDSLVQKYGGWDLFFAHAVIGIPRQLHAWEDLNGVAHLAIGTTQKLYVLTDGNLVDITPQTLTSNFAPNFSTVINTPYVTIIDPNIANVTIYDSVYFNTPVSVGGIILDGLYQITEAPVTTDHSYQITAATNATSTVSNGGSVPLFGTNSGSSLVTVTLDNHGLSTGSIAVFTIPTNGNGVTIQGSYDVTYDNSNQFSISVSAQATASGTFSMNGGDAQLVYYITLSPAPVGMGYSEGGYSDGGYSSGISGGTTYQTGTEITATDWTLDNFGEILIACPKGGGIYYYDPTGSFLNASIISTAPPFNGGIFVSMAQQIVVAYASSIHQGVGYQQQPLLVAWSDVSNFFQWTALATDQAGNDTLSPGSVIVGGIAASNQNLLWTDLDLWAMSYIGPPDVFGFNKIGGGMGLASPAAMQQLRGSVYWIGQSNFYSYTSNGAAVLPCPVWDAVFQNLNEGFLSNIRSMPNTPFNEAGWLYPSAASASGECDSYAKLNITEPNTPWDIGPMPRSAWTDQSVLGSPIGASPQGFIYQHETTNDADGVPLSSSLSTGYFYLQEGEEYTFVDQVLPDFRWTEYTGGTSAQIMMSFNVLNYQGDTPATYGPYTVNSSTEFISVRFRGRFMSITIQSNDLGSFWRIGSCKFRYSPAGRR